MVSNRYQYRNHQYQKIEKMGTGIENNQYCTVLLVNQPKYRYRLVVLVFPVHSY
ncbi:hypothetical protein HanRHA438_Chr13g0594541 [Helianthus annuus]|nr:hypothetical protein HanRHA438_Chr13g0594541 [Helianthus annuus]